MPTTLISGDVMDDMVRTACATPQGAFVEVGVYQGGSAERLVELAENQHRAIYLYDTFTGIPYAMDVDAHKVGDFSDTSFEDIRQRFPYATVVQGVFPGSALEMGPIAFAHLDVDQFQSYVEACDYLAPRMLQRGVMWFDDYGCLAGATQALNGLYSGRIEFAKCGKAMVRW